MNKAIAAAGTLYRTIMQKAYNGTAAPRSAIKAQCLACVGYERLMVTHCLASAARFGPIESNNRPQGTLRVRWRDDGPSRQPRGCERYLVRLESSCEMVPEKPFRAGL